MKEKLLRLTKSELIELVEKFYLESKDEIWEYHTFKEDNFGITKEQEDKMNELLKNVHNTAYQEIIKTIETYVNNI